MDNAVRQVLMNELGLTRESVRQEVTEIVGSVCRAYLDNLMKSGYLEKIIRTEITHIVKDPRRFAFRSDETELEAIIKLVAEDQMRKYLAEHVRISYVE